MQAMMYGRLGRGSNKPVRLPGHGLSFARASSVASSSGSETVSMEDVAATKEVVPVVVRPVDIASLPAPAPRGALLPASFAKRQGTVSWSALSK